MCGDKVEAPQPTKAEKKIQKLQLKIMKQSYQQQQALLPFVYEALGYSYNPETGAITKLPEPEKDELQQLYEERALAYMKGEGEISPTFTENVGKWRSSLEEDLSRRLGPNWQETTAGIQALNDFEATVAGLEEDIRFGRITSLDALAGGRATLMEGLKSAEIQGLQTINNPLMGIGNYGGGLLGSYQQQRQMQMMADIQNTQMANQRLTGLMGMVGQVGGIAGGVGLAKYLA